MERKSQASRFTEAGLNNRYLTHLKYLFATILQLTDTITDTQPEVGYENFPECA